MDNKNAGLIFNIERCAVHDGPGIRTVVFSKGCPLRCKWCSSPQSWDSFPEISFSGDSCIKCGECFTTCPAGAIIPDAKEYLKIDREICTNCGECCEGCSSKALKLIGQHIAEEESFSIVLKDILFYRNSKGGVTLSGGEPTTQPEFCLGLLKKCHGYNISTAMESCLYTEWEVLKRILLYLDLIYVDIKCMDTKKHKTFTGKPNELILDNAIKVDKCQVPIIVRVPVVPGYTDDEENIKATSEFVAGLSNVIRIELLPYHRLAVSEYKRLQRNYELEYLNPPSNENLQKLKEIIESYRLNVQIGG